MNTILNPKILAIAQVIIAGATLLDVFLGFDLGNSKNSDFHIRRC